MPSQPRSRDQKKVLVIPDVPKGIFHCDISFLSPPLHQLHSDAFSAASLNGTDPEFKNNLVDMNQYFDPLVLPAGDKNQATGVLLESMSVFVVVLHLQLS